MGALKTVGLFVLVFLPLPFIIVWAVIARIWHELQWMVATICIDVRAEIAAATLAWRAGTIDPKACEQQRQREARRL